MKTKLFATIFLLIFISGTAFSQAVLSTPPLDGAYKRDHTAGRKAIPYTYLREADVMWSKRVWRKLDLREKLNHPLYYPLKQIDDYQCLFSVLKNAVMNGAITAYMTQNTAYTYDVADQFLVPMNLEEAKISFQESIDSIPMQDSTGQTVVKAIRNSFKPENVKQYLIKEDWFFDRQRSVQDVRIIGINPILFYFSEAQGSEISKWAGWIYFPQARPTLAAADVYLRQNSAEKRSFDDIFFKRMFSSFIYKEENVYTNREISDYKTSTLDQLLEAEKIKNDIFTMEHDLWEW
ncbi:MAG: gliding motility protein GldN [Bacteroidota bacterium]|nr:gliding motility protein GldN [Bacteroidota bacterium]